MTVIQLPEWEGWRIADSDDGMWEVQEFEEKGGRGEPRWRAVNFFPTLDAAIGYAYERTLRESPKSIAQIREVHIECEKVKSRLLKAVKKAVAS